MNNERKPVIIVYDDNFVEIVPRRWTIGWLLEKRAILDRMVNGIEIELPEESPQES